MSSWPGAERLRDFAGGRYPGRENGVDVPGEDKEVFVALLGSVTPDALMVRETVTEDMQSRERTLDGAELAIGRVGEPAGKVRPQSCELLSDEEAPEPEAQLADRLSVACPLALLSHAVTGTDDVQARSAAQLLGGIVQPGPRPAESAMTRCVSVAV